MLPYHRAAVALRHAASVVVCAHVSPDGDAIGSVLGLTLALRATGIRAIPTLADDGDPPATYAFLPGFSLIAPARDLETPEAFVALDTPSAERLGVARPLMEASRTVVVIDHHPDATCFGTHCVLDPSMAATGEMVWRFLAALECAPTPEIALPLYVALITDTGRFTYDNTTPEALRTAAEMIEAGVDPALAARLVYQERSAAALELEARALSRLVTANDGRVALTMLSDADFAETGARPEEAEHVIDAVRELGGVDIVVLLRHRGRDVRVNLRSKTGFDVGAVARAFGGGGHRVAAGFTASDQTPDAVLLRLLPHLPGGGDT